MAPAWSNRFNLLYPSSGFDADSIRHLGSADLRVSGCDADVIGILAPGVS